jgi:hypothetical protein
MKRAQLSLSSYVVLVVFLIFVVVCASWVGPLITGFISANPTAYGTGPEKYGLWLVPAILVIGALVAFFIPNTVVSNR